MKIKRYYTTQIIIIIIISLNNFFEKTEKENDAFINIKSKKY